MAGNQNWRTPRWFLNAIEDKFGKIHHDFAATADDAVCESYSSDVLQAPIPDGKLTFCNPPWGLSRRLAARLSTVEWTKGSAKFIFLCQLAVDTKWWNDVKNLCDTYLIYPRVAYEDPTGGNRKAPNTGSMVLAFPGSGRIYSWDVSARKDK